MSSSTSAASNGKEQVMAQQQQPPPKPKMMNMNMNMKNMKKVKKNGIGSDRSGGRRMPSAEELIKHYQESEGMDTKQASIKVINDLQKALFRLITTSKSHPHQPDLINSRLLTLDMKLDSKPGYPQMLLLGVASAATYRTLETRLFPQLASSFTNIWNAVRSTTNTNPNN